jgi:cell wall-associated NlpC family hydrolase
MLGGQAVVARALLLLGVEYRMGGKAHKFTPATRIQSIDCSGLTAWTLRGLGIPMPDGSYNQIGAPGTKAVPVKEALTIPGSMLFHRSPIRRKIDHVAFSDGQGGVIEATPKRVRNKNPTRANAWCAAQIIKGVHY